jgi:hypothetical protein
VSYFAVTGTPSALRGLVEEMTRRVPAEWHRDLEAEAHLIEDGLDPLFCFRCVATAAHHSARLWLHIGNEELVEVNVLPVEDRRLTRPQWEAVIDAFVARVLEPSLESTGLHLERHNPEALETWLTQGPRERLRLFSTHANKQTAAAHPRDQERWFDFVLAAHSERSELPAGLLEDWLCRDGWGLEEARELAIAYEQQRALLKHYEETGGMGKPG